MDESASASELARQMRRMATKLGQQKAEIARLTAENSVLATQVDDYVARHDTLASEREKYLATPHELQIEVESLRGQIREAKHRRVFESMAADSNLRKEAIDDLWKLSGYTPDVDEPDPAKIKAVFDEAKTTKPYLFADPSNPPTPAPAVKNAPAPGRGSTTNPTQSIVSKAQMQDPAWMYHNQKQASESIKAGLFRA